MQILLREDTRTESQLLRFDLRADWERVSKIKLEKEVFEKSLVDLLQNLAWQAPVRGFEIQKTSPDWQEVSGGLPWAFTDLDLLLIPPQEERPEIERFEQEREAFLRIRNDLLERGRYLDEFVAIHNGEIVDHDTDIVALAHRVYTEYGYVTVYIDKVESEREVIELPSPEA